MTPAPSNPADDYANDPVLKSIPTFKKLYDLSKKRHRGLFIVALSDGVAGPLQGYWGELLCERAVADRLHREIYELRNWRREYTGPPYLYAGRTVWYPEIGLKAWIAQREQEEQERLQQLQQKIKNLTTATNDSNLHTKTQSIKTNPTHTKTQS
jgi:hypothetical protein